MRAQPANPEASTITAIQVNKNVCVSIAAGGPDGIDRAKL